MVYRRFYVDRDEFILGAGGKLKSQPYTESPGALLLGERAVVKLRHWL